MIFNFTSVTPAIFWKVLSQRSFQDGLKPQFLEKKRIEKLENEPLEWGSHLEWLMFLELSVPV